MVPSVKLKWLLKIIIFVGKPSIFYGPFIP